MSRIKIKAQGKKVFVYQDALRITDMNYGGHLGNDKVLTLFHDARMAWIKDIHQSELNFFGSSLIQHDSIVNYRMEGLHGDQISIELYIDDIDEKSFDFYYQMMKIEDQKVMAIGKTGMTFFNYDTKKIDRTPQDFLEWCHSAP